jgi:hypothetical protein
VATDDGRLVSPVEVGRVWGHSRTNLEARKPRFYLYQLNGFGATARQLASNFKSKPILSFSLNDYYRVSKGQFAPENQAQLPSGSVQYFDSKMPALVRATALAAVTIALSDASFAAACRHFSIWHFPWPQPCPARQIGQFINEPSLPTPSPGSPPTQDEEPQRQQAIEKLKEKLNSQKHQ